MSKSKWTSGYKILTEKQNNNFPSSFSPFLSQLCFSLVFITVMKYLRLGNLKKKVYLAYISEHSTGQHGSGGNLTETT